ncbi:MAG: hypothetical protein R3288_00055 [Woeseiaceae bacterium]|nr:hypothetical protein [Woeseiaceae bacterium]
MDVAWIPVFVLTLAECVAPTGKTVCQEREWQLEFVTQADCETALAEFVELKSASERVIVDADRSQCKASARQQRVYASVDAVNDAHGATEAWLPPAQEEEPPPPSRREHQERLAQLASCDDTGGAAPCKIGEIIIEGTDTRRVEIWRRDN